LLERTDISRGFGRHVLHGACNSPMAMRPRRVRRPRASASAIDPRDPDVVYPAATGGGLWKTVDVQARDRPHW
jgi:hypothetical protein